MADFLHREFQLDQNDVVEVTLDHAANVQLMDPSNFAAYERGQPFRYYGGYVERSPVRLRPPHAGRWHLVVDLGGGAGTVRASTRILKEMPAAS